MRLVRFPRRDTQVLVQWAGLDVTQSTWEPWSVVRHAHGAARAWAAYAQALEEPPALFDEWAERELASQAGPRFWELQVLAWRRRAARILTQWRDHLPSGLGIGTGASARQRS